MNFGVCGLRQVTMTLGTHAETLLNLHVSWKFGECSQINVYFLFFILECLFSLIYFCLYSTVDSIAAEGRRRKNLMRNIELEKPVEQMQAQCQFMTLYSARTSRWLA